MVENWGVEIMWWVDFWGFSEPMDFFIVAISNDIFDTTTGAYIQRQIQTNNITCPQQLFKPNILRPSTQLLTKRIPIMVLHLHAKRLCFLLQIPPNPTHAQNP